jgi:hypothetical protein
MRKAGRGLTQVAFSQRRRATQVIHTLVRKASERQPLRGEGSAVPTLSSRIAELRRPGALPKAVGSAVAMYVLLALVGCSDRGGSSYRTQLGARQDTIIIKTFVPDTAAPSRTSSSESCPKPNAGKVVVYVDASESMRGFVVRRATSIYSDLLRNMQMKLDKVYGSAGVEYCDFYSLKSDKQMYLSSMSSDEFSQMHLNPDSYAYDATPLDSLFTRFVQASDSGATGTYIVITDGVQSRKGFNFVGMRDPISEWLKKRGRSIGLFAVRSQFDGPAFSERNIVTGAGPHRLGTYTAIGADTGRFRPFYVYVFAADTADRGLLLDVVRRTDVKGLRLSSGADIVGAGLAHYLELSSSLVRAEATTVLTKLQRTRDRVNSARLVRRSGRYPVSYLQWEGQGLRGEAGYVNVSVVTPVNGVSAYDFLSGFQGCELEFRGLHRSTGRVVDACISAESVDSRIESVGNDTLLAFDMVLKMLAPQDTGWTDFQVELMPTDRTVSCPAWVTQWSSNDDSDVRDYNRTYLISDVVDGMLTNSPFRRDPLARYYLSIYR